MALRCLFGHSWSEWELIQYLNYKRSGKLTGLFVRHCPHCFKSQMKTVVTHRKKPEPK